MKFTDNFNSEEFTCGCGKCVDIINRDFVNTLQKIRDEFGPMRITSGYRCEDHNKAVGGSEKSYHMRGMAADILCASWPRRILLIQLGLKYGLTVGLGKGFIHLDSRENQIVFHY